MARRRCPWAWCRLVELVAVRAQRRHPRARRALPVRDRRAGQLPDRDGQRRRRRRQHQYTLMTDSWTDPTLPAGRAPVTTTTGSCYDATDRLLATSSTTSTGSPPPATSASYDSHGNTLTLGGQRLTFDADDRNTGLSDATGTSFENGNTALGLLQALAAIGVLVGFLFTVYKWQFSPGRGRHARRRRR